jgi:hypothetical protein
MFRSVYSVSVCCSVYCLCVNVYCTTATGCQPNYSSIYIISYNYSAKAENAVPVPRLRGGRDDHTMTQCAGVAHILLSKHTPRAVPKINLNMSGSDWICLRKYTSGSFTERRRANQNQISILHIPFCFTVFQISMYPSSAQQLNTGTA